MRFFLYAGISALIIYISPSRPQRNIVQLCIARTNKPATHLLREHIRCARENAIFFSPFSVFSPSLLQKVLPLAVTLGFFRGYICNFPTFSEIFLAPGLPAPRIHLFPSPIIVFSSNYTPIVLLPPFKLFFSSRFCSQHQSRQLEQIFAVWREMTIIAGPFIYINEKEGGKGYILMIFLARCHEY